MTLHRVLSDAIMRAAQDRFQNRVRIFRRPVGLLFTKHGQPVRVGVKGQCDLWGYLKANPFAIPFEIEVKVARDRLRDGQKDWAKTLDHLAVPHHVAHATNASDIHATAIRTAEWLATL